MSGAQINMMMQRIVGLEREVLKLRELVENSGAGKEGAQGPAGPAGPVGPVGPAERWKRWQRW